MRFTLPRVVGSLVLTSLVAAVGSGAAHAAPQEIGLGGVLPDIKTVQVENSHVYDYTFTSAPTDWHVQSGVWEMTNRWSCSPGWSWFGGRSDEIAAVWNKRRFGGDVSVQFYFAFKMGLSGNPSWAEYPSDAAITICGDGKNMGSGYSFIVGADDNQHSVLMRGSKMVAESRAPEALLPTMADGRPDNNELHRRWWYVRINKIGPRVECWLDNKLLFTYNDPKPLDAGQIALWTYNNGIMLSRVQVFYEDELKAGPRQMFPTSVPTLVAAAPQKQPVAAVKTPAKTTAVVKTATAVKAATVVKTAAMQRNAGVKVTRQAS